MDQDPLETAVDRVLGEQGGRFTGLPGVGCWKPQDTLNLVGRLRDLASHGRVGSASLTARDEDVVFHCIRVLERLAQKGEG